MNKLIVNLKKIIIVVIVYIFNHFPIKKNKIFIFSYYGSQYGCSPKYISEYIVRNCPKGKYDIVWAFNDVKSKKYITGVRKVKTMSLKYFYELCTSRVVITNFRTTDSFVKRKNQYYIQTWHSSLRLKQIEMDAEKSLTKEYTEMAKKDSLKCDLLLSGCKYSTHIFKRAFWYDGEIFECGTPRNDIFFQSDELNESIIRNKLNIPRDVKLAMYAPTFRKGNEIEVYDLNYSEVLNKLEKRFGGKWLFLVKLHPHLISKSDKPNYCKDVLDVTNYDDVQELLNISDILVTDYSSLMFDYSLTGRPCFLYVPDIKDYISNDRNLYFDIALLPFISAVSNNELLSKIESFNYNEYKNRLRNFSKEINSFEEGQACEKLVKHLNKVCFS
jgi:CDP-glycerol glycerophosphotransferase